MGTYIIGKALNGLYNNVLLCQIMISNTRSKRVTEHMTNVAHTTKKISIHANFHVSFSFCFH